MKVKIKLAEGATMPSYSKVGDAGLDLTTTGVIDENALYIEYGTGVHVQIPEGHVGLVFPRSSISKYDLILANSVGVIDSNYTGEIKFRFKYSYNLRPLMSLMSNPPEKFIKGDKIGQLIIVPIPSIEFEQVDELDETVRGEQSFGSSGK